MPKKIKYYKRQLNHNNPCWIVGCAKWPIYYSIRNDLWFCYKHKKEEEENLTNE